jgi:hypothetical protein
MPTGTYELITAAAPGATTSYTFSSIPTTYTNLVLVGNTTSGGTVNLRFNGDSSGNYYALEMWGPNGADVYTQRDTGATGYDVRDSGTTLGNSPFIVNIQQYKNTNVCKSLTSEMCDDRYFRAYRRQGYWNNTAAINSITIFSTASWASGTTFSLYGIKGE